MDRIKLVRCTPRIYKDWIYVIPDNMRVEFLTDVDSLSHSEIIDKYINYSWNRVNTFMGISVQENNANTYPNELYADIDPYNVVLLPTDLVEFIRRFELSFKIDISNCKHNSDNVEVYRMLFYYLVEEMNIKIKDICKVVNKDRNTIKHHVDTAKFFIATEYSYKEKYERFKSLIKNISKNLNK